MQTNAQINPAATENEIIDWIWDNLIPDSGQATVLQGELVRAVEKLRWEAQNNGNINWDDRFEMFLDFLEVHLIGEPKFSHEIKISIQEDLNRLRNFLSVDDFDDDTADPNDLPYVDDDLYDRLITYVVNFCRIHPTLIPHKLNPNQYM